jgi:hypothetical protein
MSSVGALPSTLRFRTARVMGAMGIVQYFPPKRHFPRTISVGRVFRNRDRFRGCDDVRDSPKRYEVVITPCKT